MFLIAVLLFTRSIEQTTQLLLAEHRIYVREFFCPHIIDGLGAGMPQL